MSKSCETGSPLAGLPGGRLAYSLREAALALGISESSVRRLLQRGLIRSSGALRHKLIPAFELERFLRESLR